MADKGFLIQDLDPLGAALNIPPNNCQEKRLSKQGELLQCEFLRTENGTDKEF